MGEDINEGILKSGKLNRILVLEEIRGIIFMGNLKFVLCVLGFKIEVCILIAVKMVEFVRSMKSR